MTDKLANLEKAIRELQELYDDPDIVIPASQLPEKENPYKDFMDRNPMAGGGMLVQPSADGSRPGYARPKKDIKEYPSNVQKLIKDYGVKKYNKLPNHQQYNIRQGNKNVGTGGGSQTPIKYEDKPKKYTKKIIEELSKDLPKGVHYNKQYNKFVGTLTGPDGKKVTKSLVATESNKKVMIDWADKTKTKLYPNRLTDDEFKKLRLKNRKLSNAEFAKLLNKKNKTTDLGYGFDTHSVNTRNLRLFPNEKFGPYVFRTIDEAKEIAKRYPGGKMLLKAGAPDNEILAFVSDRISQEKKGLIGNKAFPFGFTNENKMWRNFYNSSLKENGRMELTTKIPKDKNDNIDWTIKDKNGVPAWKKAKFFDKKTGATYTWGGQYKPGDLAKQVDAAYGQGFFARSVKVYDEQAAFNKQTFNGRSLNEIFREGLLKKELETKLDRPLTNSKADQKLLKQFYAIRKPRFSFTEAHHIEGVAENPFRMEVSYKAANRKQGNLLNSYNAGKLTKAEYTKQLENLSDTKGGIRFKTDGKFIGETATPETIIKAAAQDIDMKPLQVEKMLATFSNNPKCIITFGKAKAAADGGRIGYQTGTVSLSDCAKDGAKNFQEGKFKTADQAQDAAKLLGGGQKVLRGLMKYGIVPEAAYVAGEAVFRNILGEKPLNALKKSVDTFTFGLTDFTSGIEAEKFGKDADLKLSVDKFRASQNKVNSIEQEIANLETLNTGSQFGYEGDQTEAIQMKKVELEAAKKELEQNYVNPDMVQYIDRKGENIADAQMAKSGYAKASLKDQMDGIPGVTDYMDTETARVFPKQPSQAELNLKLLPNFRESLKTDQGKIDRVIMNAPDDVLKDISPEALDLKRGLQEAYKMENLKDVFGAEQIYGTQGSFFGEPLAKGGRAGFKSGALRKGVLSLIDKSVKSTPKDTTSALDKLIKQTLDEDLFDKKDRIVDSINISEAKKRKNYPYNMRVFEEPKNLDFYRAIKESNFKTKTGPFFDRIKKAGGGLLKQAGDRSGAMLESMNPDSQGLQGILNRVKKIQE